MIIEFIIFLYMIKNEFINILNADLRKRSGTLQVTNFLYNIQMMGKEIIIFGDI